MKKIILTILVALSGTQALATSVAPPNPYVYQTDEEYKKVEVGAFNVKGVNVSLEVEVEHSICTSLALHSELLKIGSNRPSIDLYLLKPIKAETLKPCITPAYIKEVLVSEPVFFPSDETGHVRLDLLVPINSSVKISKVN